MTLAHCDGNAIKPTGTYITRPAYTHSHVGWGSAPTDLHRNSISHKGFLKAGCLSRCPTKAQTCSYSCKNAAEYNKQYNNGIYGKLPVTKIILMAEFLY